MWGEAMDKLCVLFQFSAHINKNTSVGPRITRGEVTAAGPLDTRREAQLHFGLDRATSCPGGLS